MGRMEGLAPTSRGWGCLGRGGWHPHAGSLGWPRPSGGAPDPRRSVNRHPVRMRTPPGWESRAVAARAAGTGAAELSSPRELGTRAGRGSLCPSPRPFSSRHFAEGPSAHWKRSHRAQQLSHRSLLTDTRWQTSPGQGPGLSVATGNTESPLLRRRDQRQLPVSASPLAADHGRAAAARRPARSQGHEEASPHALPAQTLCQHEGPHGAAAGAPHCAFSIRPTGAGGPS